MIKRFNEYYLNNYQRLIKSLEKFEITEDEYYSIIYRDEGEYTPKEWIEINDREKNLIVNYKTENFDSDPYYVLLQNNILCIDLVKVPDDYYYVLIDGHYSTYYKFDQLPELKYFIKQLNIYKSYDKKI